MNVTPLIDVLLVLLIIFMAALPLTQKGLDINVPAAVQPPAPPPPDGQIVVEHFIIGAPTLRYGEIVNIIDAARGAGVDKVGIVTMGMRGGS